MDAYDILRVANRNKMYIDEFVLTKGPKLYHEAKKRRVNAIWRCFDLTCGRVEYKAVIRTSVDKTCRLTLFAYCQESNLYIRIMPNEDFAAYLRHYNTQAFTPHFIRRFSERYYHDKAFDLNQTFARMEREFSRIGSGLALLLYYNKRNGNTAHAFFGGLALGTDGKEKLMTIYKTFVPYEMLGDTQRKAYDACSAMLAEQQKIYGEDLTDPMMTDDAFRDYLNERTLEYQPIYEEFFKQKKI